MPVTTRMPPSQDATWRIIPWLGYVVNNHGDRVRPLGIIPFPNGLFIYFFFMGGYALLTILGARCFFPAESEGLTWEFLNSPKHVLVPADTLKYIISPFLIGNISSNGPFPSIFQCYVSLPQCNSSCWWWRAINYTFDGNAANQLIWRSSHYLQGFYTFQVVQDFFHQP